MISFERSRQLHERASKTCPGGIQSNVRAIWQPVPMFYDRGEGSHVWDADGNEYIDYVLARGPLLLGHSPGPVIEAVKRQLDRGLMYAGQQELEVQAAEKFVELVPCADMVRFSNSGSEAVHAAIRLARAVTGRTQVIKFEGHYHGWLDNELWSVAPSVEAAGARETPRAVAGSRGMPPSEGENLVVLPWNDLPAVQAAFARAPGQIAAVITEPIMCNCGAIMPRKGYLAGLRDLCTQHGALLIFDEVITGFRVKLGGAQSYFSVMPDLATFAKGMAGGFPVSALAGNREYMEAFGTMTVTHAGTYNGNGPCMAATVAALEMLSADGGALLTHAQRMGRALLQGITDAGKAAGRNVKLRGVPACFNVSFDDAEEVVDYRSSLSRDTAAYGRFWSALQDRGVRTIPGGLWFVSTAHTEQDVEKTLAAVREAMKA